MKYFNKIKGYVFSNILFIIMLLGAQTVFARDNTSLPEELKYKGKPISAVCIDKLINTDSDSDDKGDANSKSAAADNSNSTDNSTNTKNKEVSVDLATCDVLPKDTSKGKADKDLIQKGFIGTELKYKSFPAAGYNYYKYIGKAKDAYVLYYISSGGGSGSFTNLMLVKRDGDKLVFDRMIAAGDRCNGGVDEPILKNNIIYYSVSITPYDYIPLADENNKSIQAYDDLAACAACCLGKANFEDDFEKSRLISVDFGQKVTEQEAPFQGNYQSCFNRMVMDYQKRGKNKLNPTELKEFVRTFTAECMKGRTQGSAPTDFGLPEIVKNIKTL